MALTPWQRVKVRSSRRTRSDRGIGIENGCQRFVAGVLRVTRPGARRRLLPVEYGRRDLVCKRFGGWRDRGVREAFREHLADDPDTEYLIIDSAIVRVHPDAAGGVQKVDGQE